MAQLSEWLQLMLAEIARKQAEQRAAMQEQRERERAEQREPPVVQSG